MVGELSPGGSIALGVVVGLLSTSVQSVGLTLQRKSHLLEDEKEEHRTRRPPYRRRRWQLGMLMFIIANLVGSTIQITTLPLPVLSTLQASGLVFNSLCASLILSEPFTRYSLAGTILVATGAVLIGTFGALTEPPHTLPQLLSLLGRQQFLLWLFSTFVVALLILLATWLLTRLYPRSTPHMRLTRGMAFGCVSGILSAHSLLVAKSAVELLVRTVVDRHNQFRHWQSWMILLGLVFLALSQLYYLHRGLKLCSTSVLYPFVFCVYNIIAILDGLIYFRQTSRLPVLDAVLIAVGTVILLSGVLALSWRLEGQYERDGETVAKTHRRSSVRIAAPQTALTPGMGLVGSDTEDDDGSSVVSDDLRGHDEENGLLEHDRRTSPASERTPLLRAASGSDAASTQRLKRDSLRSKKRRRMTLSEEACEIWDELNDQDDHRGSSIDRSLQPSSSTDAKGKARARYEDDDPDDISQSHRTGRRSPERIGSRQNSVYEEPDGEETEDSLGHVGPDGRRRWSQQVQKRRKGSTASREDSGGWLPLRWWKRRRRDGDGSAGRRAETDR